MRQKKKYKIQGQVDGIIEGRTLKNPEIEFYFAEVHEDQTETIYIKYTDECGSVIRPYKESETRQDYDQYIVNHLNHSGIKEVKNR